MKPKMFVSVWIFCLVSGLLAEGEVDPKKVQNENLQADSSSELTEFLQAMKVEAKKEMQAMEARIVGKVNSNYNSLTSRVANLESQVSSNYKYLKANQIRCVEGHKYWNWNDVTEPVLHFKPKFKKQPTAIVALRGWESLNTIWLNWSITPSYIKLVKSKAFNAKAKIVVSYLVCGV